MEESEQHQSLRHDEDDEGELEEGPPPGFNSIPSQPQQQEQQLMEQDDDVINGDGDETKGDDDDDDDEVKGPPPGFSTPPILRSVDVEMGSKEDDIDEDDGPPPGWNSVITIVPPPAETPSATTAAFEISNVEVKNDVEDIEDEDEEPPPGWHSIPPMNPHPPSISGLPPLSETASKQGEQGPQLKRQSLSPSQLLPPMQQPPRPHGASLPPEMGQMVCGSCRQLLSYPRGAKYVQCVPCQTVNLVLEAHQVGQVKCGGCSVLLMYPYGSPAVRCSTCRFVTEIGAHNSRPPLSEQQARRRRPRPRSNRVH